VTSAELCCRLLASTIIALVIIVVVVVLAAAGVAVDDVGHVQQILRARGQRVAGRQHREPEEVEHAEQGRAVWARALEAEDDVRALELLLRVLQQFNQALPGALGQDAWRDLHVEARLQQDGLPLHLQPRHRRHLEAKVDRWRRVWGERPVLATARRRRRRKAA